MSKHKFLFKHSVLYNNSKSLFCASSNNNSSSSSIQSTEDTKNNDGTIQEKSLPVSSPSSSIPASVVSTRYNNVPHEFSNNNTLVSNNSNFITHDTSPSTSSSNVWNSTVYPSTTVNTTTTTNEDDFENSRVSSVSSSSEPILLSTISKTSASTSINEVVDEIPAALKPTDPYDLSINSISCPESFSPLASPVLTNLSSQHHVDFDETISETGRSGSNIIQNPTYTYYYHHDDHVDNHRNSYNNFIYKYHDSNNRNNINYSHNTHHHYSSSSTTTTSSSSNTSSSSHSNQRFNVPATSIQHYHPHQQRIQYYDNSKNHPGGDYYSYYYNENNNGGEEVPTRLPSSSSSSSFILHNNEEPMNCSGEYLSSPAFKSTSKNHDRLISNESEFHPVIVSQPIISSSAAAAYSSDGLTILASAASTQPMSSCSVDTIHDQRHDKERPDLNSAIFHPQSEQSSVKTIPFHNNSNTNAISVIKTNTISVITRVPTTALNKNYSSISTITNNSNDKNHADSTLIVNEKLDEKGLETSSNEKSEEHQQEKAVQISPDNKNILIHPEGNRNTYECRVCAKRFKSKNNFKYHIHDSNWKFPFKCKVCDKGFIASTHYKLHIKTHQGERKYQCEACPKAFFTSQKLSRHSMSIHNGQKKFVCSFELCTRSFHTPMELDNHSLVHSGQLGYSCSICRKKFKSESQLKVHEFNHKDRPMKTFPCSLCELKFTRLNHLQNHMLIHQGIKAFKCEKCTGRSFRTKFALAHHMKAHNDERPFVCQFPNCHSAFFLKKDLIRHEHVHTDKADFHCVDCEKNFGRKDNLIRHIKMHHGEETERE